MKITADMKTPWFPANESPAREGVYETRTKCFPGPKRVLFERGRWWKHSSEIGKFASAFPDFLGAEWRGLKEKPE